MKASGIKLSFGLARTVARIADSTQTNLHIAAAVQHWQARVDEFLGRSQHAYVFAGVDIGGLLTQIAAAVLGLRAPFFMEFMHSPPDVIRSGLQRRLLDYWNGLRGSASVPAWPGIAITELRPFSADLVCTQVVPVE